MFCDGDSIFGELLRGEAVEGIECATQPEICVFIISANAATAPKSSCRFDHARRHRLLFGCQVKIEHGSKLSVVMVGIVSRSDLGSQHRVDYRRNAAILPDMLITFDTDKQRYEARGSYEENVHVRGKGWRWDPAGKCWHTKEDGNAADLAQFADDATRERLKGAVASMHAAALESEKMRELSRATTADVEIPCNADMAYLPYQKGGIAYALQRLQPSSPVKGVLIGDEMGLGKTIQAIGISNAVPEIRSVLIVCPATPRLNWHREWKKWCVKGLRVEIALGKIFPKSDVVIVGYDGLKKFQAQIRSRQWDLLIADEVHRAKNKKAQRSKYLWGYVPSARMAHKEDPIPPIPTARFVVMSGTPLVNRPIELWPIIEHLDPNGLGKNFFRFAQRFCAAYNNGYGWDFKGASNLGELQDILRGSIMVRRLKSEVLKELPPKRRQVVPVEIDADDSEASAAVVAETAAWERAEKNLETARVEMELAKAAEDQNEYAAAVRKLKDAQKIAFNEMSAARKRTAIAKIPYLIEHLEEAVENSGKVVAFVHHHEVMDAIMAHFGPVAVKIDGRVTKPEDRQAAVDRFQTDPTCTLFSGGITAAGEAITLTAASHVVAGELDWRPGIMSQCEDRCHRYGQRDSVFIQHLVLDGSIDARMAKVIVDKQDVIDRALDTKTDTAPIDPDEPVLPDVSSDRGLPPPSGPRASEIRKERETAATAESKPWEIAKEAETIGPHQVAAIHNCLKMLAGSDWDRTSELNGVGFNKFDGIIGHSLAEAETLSPRQAALGRKIVAKYKRQLPPHLLRTAKGDQ